MQSFLGVAGGFPFGLDVGDHLKIFFSRGMNAKNPPPLLIPFSQRIKGKIFLWCTYIKGPFKKVKI